VDAKGVALGFHSISFPSEWGESPVIPL